MKRFADSSLIFLALGVCSCQEPPPVTPDDRPNGAAVDETTLSDESPDDDEVSLDLSNIEYSTRFSDGGWEDPEPVDLCNLVNHETDYLGLVEVVAVNEREVLEDCNDKEYVGVHRILEFREVAAANGVMADTAAESVPVVMISMFFERTPIEGEVLLVAMRKSLGEWFVLQQLVASTPGDYEAGRDEREVDLPPDFATLTVEANAVITDYAAQCPERVEYQVDTDDEFAVRIRSPKPCGPDSESTQDGDTDFGD